MQKRSRACDFACEQLERRTLFAVATWISTVDGDWQDSTNWSGGHVPVPGDSVVINVPGHNITVTYSDNSNPLVLGNITNDELIDISGTGGATWTSGTLDGSGTVEVGSTLAISGSADKILKDGQTIENLGTTTLNGTGNIVGQVGAAIVNLGLFNVLSDADITFPAGVGSGIFENGGIFMKSGGGTAPGDMTEIGGAQGFSFENSITDTVAEELSTPGICEVQQGMLAVGDLQSTAITYGGTYLISTGATLNFLQGVANILRYKPQSGPETVPSITGPGGTVAGTLDISGANVTINGTVAVDTINVSGGSLLLDQNIGNGGTTQSNTNPVTLMGKTNTLNVSGGSIGGYGGGLFPVPAPINQEQEPALVVSSIFSWSGGGFLGGGRVVINSTVTSSTITGSTPKFVNGGFGLDLLCETDWTGSGTISENGNSAILVHGGGTLFDQGNGTINEGSVDANGGFLLIAGNFLKSGGNGTTTIGPNVEVVNDANFLNDVTFGFHILQFLDPGSVLNGKITVDSGTLSLQGTTINRNDILIGPNSTLSLDGGAFFNQSYSDSNNADNAEILGVNAGNVNFGTASFDSDSLSLIDVASATFGTGTYSFQNTAPGGHLFQTGVFNGVGTGTISGSGVLEVTSSFIWNSGSFAGTAATSGLLIDAGATLTIPSGDRATSGGYSVTNNGTIAWTTSPGSLTIAGNYTQGASGRLVSNILGISPSFDRLNVSGTTTLAGGLTLSLVSFVPSDGQRFILINNTSANLISGSFSGFADGSTITIGTSKFVVSYTGGDGNDLTLTAVVFPTINIATPPAITEGNSGTKNLIFTVTLSQPVTRAVSVNYATSDGTAIAGQDYTATSGTLTILAGRTSGTISVPIIGDMLVEPNETFFVNLSNPVNGALGLLTVATGTILNDDGPPVITFSQTSYAVSDLAGIATITVFNSNSSVPVTVQYATTPGTAVIGTDYTPVAGTLIFAVGVTSQTFNVPIIHNLLAQTNTTFNVTLFNAQGGSASVGTSTAVVTILDTNIPPATVSIADVNVTEPIFGQINAVFAITVANPSATPFTVDYTTVGGTATQDVDYVGTAGTLTFAANQSTAQILVPINSDFINESTETFTVVLSNPTGGAQLGIAVATGTIANQLVNVVTLDAQHPYRFDDVRGNVATIALQGPGSGTISYLGQPLDDSRELILNNTTAQSTLSVRTTKAETFLVDLTVNGPLRAINGPTLGLLGNLTVTGGLQTLRLDTLQGGNTINIGAGTGTFRNMAANIGTITDSTFNSALPITTFKVNSWIDSDDAVDLTAPSINSLVSTSDFSADITLTGNLGTMRVGRGLSDSIIRVGGNINTIAARTIADSSIFAGMPTNLTTLPTTTAQFTNRTSLINNITVNGGASNSFSNTLIAAPNIGNLQLGLVNPNNASNPFGAAASSIRSARIRNGGGVRETTATLQGNPFTEIDLQIYLTT